MKTHSGSIVTVNITKNTKVKRNALWQHQGLTKGKKAPTELMLRQSLRRIFPHEEIVFKARKALNIKRNNDTEKAYLEVDASIPRLKFHVEYQDPYHYTASIHYSNRPLVDIQAIDTFKKECLAERGESLLQLPCWWDGTDESLVATIKSMRPDLLPHHNSACQPVPETEPYGFLLYDFVPDAGPLMRPVFFTKNYYKQGSIWLGNEKLDGVRCCWNHMKQRLYSRSGNELRYPEEFKHHMPDSFLDGEVWFGRGQYNEAAKLSVMRISAINWPLFRISVFDKPGTESTQITYTERHSNLHAIITNDHPFLFIPSMIQINNEEQRLRFEKLIANNSGEGMILTEKNSLYVHGHTSKVLKVKPSLDKEALVISSDNKYLTLQLTDGTHLRTHTPNIYPPPRVSDVITFSYNRCVQGSSLPEKPQIQRVRSDVTWSEVVASANEEYPPRGLGRDYSTRWDRNLDDLKGYFTKFARDNNFDPLVSANWYKVQRQDIVALPGAFNMLKGFNGSVINALVASFPDIGIDKSMFSRVPRGHWKNTQNIKNWFYEFSKQKEFDPLIAKNWYNITHADILDKEGGHNILQHFNYSHINAVVASYPDIGLDKSMFSTVPRGHWKHIHNVKKWFNEFSKQNGFDPLVAKNWYNITRNDILEEKDGRSILHHFNGSHLNALVASYPDIGLVFSVVPSGHWKHIHNVKKWFDEFSKQKGFDPLIAKNWYNLTYTDMLDKEGGHSIIDYFNGSYVNALVASYPDIGLDKSIFSTVPQRHWKYIHKIRMWFDEFSKRKGFDPLIATNWYNITCNDILGEKDGCSILHHFNYSHINAIVGSYPDIGIDKSMFSRVPKGHWKHIHNIREWFYEFSEHKGFDPLVAKNWYKITRSDILGKKNGCSILRHFNDSHINALVASYPDIGLDKSMFSTVPRRYWRDVQNVRKWFDEFAHEQGFEPLVAQNWYDTQICNILAKKGANGILKNYKKSYINAIVASYPDIGINAAMFSTV